MNRVSDSKRMNPRPRVAAGAYLASSNYHFPYSFGAVPAFRVGLLIFGRRQKSANCEAKPITAVPTDLGRRPKEVGRVRPGGGSPPPQSSRLGVARRPSTRSGERAETPLSRDLCPEKPRTRQRATLFNRLPFLTNRRPTLVGKLFA